MNLTQVSIYDLISLHKFFSKKIEPSTAKREEDKQRIIKIEQCLRSIVDSIMDEQTFQKLRDQKIIPS